MEENVSKNPSAADKLQERKDRLKKLHLLRNAGEHPTLLTSRSAVCMLFH